MSCALGIDIGGTKCAVSLGRSAKAAEAPEILWRDSFGTAEAGGAYSVLGILAGLVDRALAECKIGIESIEAIGISCGGPLDARRGLILSPPNLPLWDAIPVVGFFRERYGVPAVLQNDANACAFAEWRYGAGRGARSLVFLTFGTGLGAGLILDGRLYEGASCMAGELGHVRLADSGPVGYGKAGSFEGFCSGGGIAQLARSMARERLLAGEAVSFCPRAEDLPRVDAKLVAAAARSGDPAAIAVFERSGSYLGKGLSLVIDILNPEAIILGGIFPRCEDLLRPAMEAELSRETLAPSLAACRILPAGLGERLGDYAALAIAFGKPAEGSE